MNTITLAKNFTLLLDEAYRAASVTADLTGGPEMSRAGVNANEICYPQIAVNGLGDYDRNSGYTYDSLDSFAFGIALIESCKKTQSSCGNGVSYCRSSYRSLSSRIIWNRL